MMTEWVLVVMMCGRNCRPQYAVVYPTQAACYQQLPKEESTWSQPKLYCVPRVTN